MSKRTSPLWIWAGPTNANSPTGNNDAAVVVEIDGRVRAAGSDETNVGAETVLAIFVSDVAPLLPVIGEPGRVFALEGDRVVGWAVTLEDLTAMFTPKENSPSSSGCIEGSSEAIQRTPKEEWNALSPEQRQAVKNVIALKGRIDCIQALENAPKSLNFMDAAKESARQTLLCGDDTPADAIAKASAEVERIESELSAALGAGSLVRLISLFYGARSQNVRGDSEDDEYPFSDDDDEY